jgi:hypothetical protein
VRLRRNNLLRETRNGLAVVHRSGMIRPLATVAVVKKVFICLMCRPLGASRHAAANVQVYVGYEPSVGVLIVPATGSFYTANGQQDRIIIRDDNAAGLGKNKQKNSFPYSSRSFTTSPVFWMLSSPRRQKRDAWAIAVLSLLLSANQERA